MAEEMPKNYDPAVNEPAILQKWLDGGYYKRREGVGDCTVTIPPPNVTGILHMGHATDDSIQDAIVRMARMRGRSTAGFSAPTTPVSPRRPRWIRS